ncbi:MAG TPA: amidase family protein, partial [Polyangiaceae bacterium]|nr:amidase family protein [Polyangiaceae bacterium]
QLALLEASIAELRRALGTGLVTPAELTEMYLARIAAFDDAGPGLNAYQFVNPNAVEAARALGTRCQDMGTAPPLCGIPVVLKDNIDTFDMPTTAGSLALAGSLPSRDAFLTQRLREAGAVLLGKATLTEFANFLTTGMPSGYSSLGGFGFNPYDPRPAPASDGRPVLTPGGSSSGPAIAVSANLAAVGVGTETSGSILSPASSNGIVGIKPTLGLISRSGVIPISADQDTAGPLARSVTDAAILLGVLAGADTADAATGACQQAGACPSDYSLFLDAQALRGARVAVPPFPTDRREIMQAAIDQLRASGAAVETISPLPGAPGACTSVPAGNNCSTVLLYGFKQGLDAYLAATPAAPISSLEALVAFNAATPGAAVYGQVLALAAAGLDTAPDSADSARYRADRGQALEAARSALDAVYDGADAVAGTDDDVDALLFSENLGAGLPAIAGYPSITLPGGFVPPSDPVEASFPSGVTFSGRAFSEPRLIGLAYAFEQATLHRAPPPSAPALASDVVRRAALDGR